jgi:two-component system, NarL family, nitrate/nitrite response regulator NarL
MIKVLIADDHRIFIDGVKSLLEQAEGIDVVGEAGNGQEAIDQAMALIPDVMLMDIQMPVKTGIEATREIVKLNPDVKIIALTMLNESTFIKKMLEAGAYGYVLKTIDTKELVNVIRKVAAGEKHLSPDVNSLLINNFTDKTRSNQTPLESLTKREREILILIAQGLTDKQIAEMVFLSPLTIITHRKNLLSKLGLKNKVELTRFAIENKLST